jgi:hypothetical protein
MYCLISLTIYMTTVLYAVASFLRLCTSWFNANENRDINLSVKETVRGVPGTRAPVHADIVVGLEQGSHQLVHEVLVDFVLRMYDRYMRSMCHVQCVATLATHPPLLTPSVMSTWPPV